MQILSSLINLQNIFPWMFTLFQFSQLNLISKEKKKYHAFP